MVSPGLAGPSNVREYLEGEANPRVRYLRGLVLGSLVESLAISGRGLSFTCSSCNRFKQAPGDAG